MADDTTLTSVFDYAKSLNTADDPTFFPRPRVFATFVEHTPYVHPGGDAPADLVHYANGPLELSDDKKSLTGEMKLWKNVYRAPNHSFDTPSPEDLFTSNPDVTIAIVVNDSGQATVQKKLRGKSIGGMPPSKLNAAFDKAMYVDKGDNLRSLSFTLA